MVTLGAVLSTIRASAAGVGIVIAVGTVIASQVMFRSRFVAEESSIAEIDYDDAGRYLSLDGDVPRRGDSMIWGMKVPSGPVSGEEGDVEGVGVVGGEPLTESQTSRSDDRLSEYDYPVGADASGA